MTRDEIRKLAQPFMGESLYSDALVSSYIDDLQEAIRQLLDELERRERMPPPIDTSNHRPDCMCRECAML